MTLSLRRVLICELAVNLPIDARWRRTGIASPSCAVSGLRCGSAAGSTVQATRTKLATYWRNQLAGVEVLEFLTDRHAAVKHGPSPGSHRLPSGTTGLIGRRNWPGRRELDVAVAAFSCCCIRYCADRTTSARRTRTAHRLRLIGDRTLHRHIGAAHDVSGDPSFRERPAGQARASSEAYAHGGLLFETSRSTRWIRIVDPLAHRIFRDRVPA